ncbi:MAG: glycosyltransferase [bacterium]|nr:glycosyltransferase [bacterium]
MDNEIKVSIHCITYNHAKFIRQALDGFVMQKTNFKFEVLIHDDASTDGTAEIIKEYEKKYPNIIKPIYQTENQWSKGVSISKIFQWPRIQGKYVALCEGDDYWTDPHKLQKQVDFLEAHPEYSICFHPVQVIWENGEHKSSIYPSKSKIKRCMKNPFEQLLKVNYIQTNSVMYRWRKDICEVFPDKIIPGDWYMHLVHAQVGKISYLPDVMSVYRKHEGGIWFNPKNRVIKYGKNMVKFYDSIYKNIANYSQDYLYRVYLPNFKEITDTLYQNAEFSTLQEIYENYKEIYELSTQNGSGSKLKYKRLYNLFLALSVCLLGLCILLFFK